MAKLLYGTIVLVRSADTTRAISFFVLVVFFFHRRAKWILRSFYSFVRTKCRLVAGRLDVHSLCACDFGAQCFNSEFIFLRRVYTASIWYTPFSFILFLTPHLSFSLFPIDRYSWVRSDYLIAVIYTNAHTHTHWQTDKKKRIEKKCLTNKIVHRIFYSAVRYTAQLKAQPNTHTHTVLIQLFQYVQFHNMCKYNDNNCVCNFIHHLICCSVFAHSYEMRLTVRFTYKVRESINNGIFSFSGRSKTSGDKEGNKNHPFLIINSRYQYFRFKC